MVGIFGGDALRSLAAATPAEQVECIETFDTYERGLIAHAPVAEMKPAQPKPLRLKVNPYEGKEGENLHFWVREVELAMDAALISTERLRVAFALSNLGGRAKTWAYTREAEMKPAQPKPLRLKVNPYEGKEGENLHFWVREVELAMYAALISTKRLRIAFALSNLG
ncbi:Gag protein, partial [Phytophthora palmivora]